MSELFGQLISPLRIERAAIEVLREWLPTYLAEVERQEGLPHKSIRRPPIPECYYEGTDFQGETAAALPVVIVSAHPKGPPEYAAEGYFQPYELGVACVVEGDTELEAHQHAAAYGAATMLLAQGQRASLGGLAQDMQIVGAPDIELVLAEPAQRRLQRAVTTFTLWVANILEPLKGPLGATLEESFPEIPGEAEGEPLTGPVVETTRLILEGETPSGDAAAPPAGYKQVILGESSLVAYYRIDDAGSETEGVARDEKGTVNGQYHGSVPLAEGALTQSGDDDPAGSFMADGDFIVIPDNGALHLSSSLSVECWYYSVTFAAGYCLFEKSIGSVYDSSFNLTVQNSKPQLLIAVGEANRLYVVIGSELSLNTWYHIVGTYDGANLRIYVNTVPTELSVAGAANTGVGESRIAALVGGPLQQTFGRIDELAVYNTPLSAQQVEAHYKAAH